MPLLDAITSSAEQAYAALDAAGQAAAKRMLLELVAVGQEEGTEDTRRRVFLDHLLADAQQPDGDTAPARQALDAFLKARLVTVRREHLAERGQVPGERCSGLGVQAVGDGLVVFGGPLAMIWRSCGSCVGSGCSMGQRVQASLN